MPIGGGKMGWGKTAPGAKKGMSLKTTKKKGKKKRK